LVVPPQAFDLHHARNRQEAPGDDVVLKCAQIGQAEMRRADELVAIDFADQARLLDFARPDCPAG